MPISYINLKKLDDFEIAKLKTLVERESKKIMRPKHKLENANLVVNVKTKNVEGAKKLYQVILKLDAPGTPKGLFDVSHEDWEMERAVHRVFANLKTIVLHRLRVKRGGGFKDV